MSRAFFLMQLLPLLVFIVVDALVTDVRISIAAAVVAAAVQLVATWVRTKKLDWFVVLDVALIVALGGVSIALENELFFKVKPAIIEAITLVIFAALVLAPDRVLAAYVGRLTPNLELKPGAVGFMKTMLKWMSAVTVVHVGAVLWAAFEASKETWALVSGPGFYVMVVPVLAVLLRRERRRAEPSP